MKKFLAIAAAALMVAACGGNKGGFDKVEPIKDGVTIENESYSLMVPQGFKESWNSSGVINASDGEGALFSINYQETGGPTKSNLKQMGENYKSMVHALDQEAKSDDPKIDGDLLTVRSLTGGKVRIDYAYVIENGKGIFGMFTFPEDKAAQYEDKLLPILKSVVIK